MKEGRGRGSYSAAFVVMIVTMISLAAASLTVIFGSQGAFPVRVFGEAAAGDDALAGSGLRGEGAGGVLRGALSSLLASAAGLDELGVDDTTVAAASASIDPMLERARTLSAAQNWTEALSAYDRILSRGASPDEVIVERARVLSWSGRSLDAAHALREVAQRRPTDVALRVEAAQFYWWAGDAVAADELLSEAVSLGARGAEIDAFRLQLRGAITPDVRTASRWVAESGDAGDRLALARALLAEGRWPEALTAFQDALDTRSVSDSVYLEVAATAAAADSTDLSIAALREYLRLHPDERSVQLSLARAYQWAGRYEQAAGVYASYLSAGEDPDARFELAQILAWSDRTDEAALEARRAALARPDHAPTYRLLGDLANWRGDYELAIANYRYASDLAPGDPNTLIALADAERAYAANRIASMPLSLGQCAIQVESFTDSEGFRWTSTRGSRRWDTAWGLVELAVQQDLTNAEVALAPGRRLGGLGATASLRIPVARTATLDLLGGTSHYADFGSYVVAGLGLDVSDVGGATVAARYRHQPAFARAATLASIEAGTVSDLIEVSIARPFGQFATSLALEAERLSSEYGQTHRYGANLSVSRPVSSRVSVAGALSLLGTTGDSPTLPDGRALYWTPELYVAPSLGVTYRMPIGDSWSVAGTVAPGMAYVKERSGSAARFGSSLFPTLGVTLDAAYRAGDWEVGGVASWGGSVDPTGYRASTVRLRGAYRLDER